MIFARILLSILIFNTTAVLAETGRFLGLPEGSPKPVSRVFIGKVDRVSQEFSIVGHGKTREQAEADLQMQRWIIQNKLYNEAQTSGGLGRQNFSMRLLAYESEVLPPSYRHVSETPIDGVTISEKFVVRSSYNVLTSRQSNEAKNELTSLKLYVLSGDHIPIYEPVLNLSAFDVSNDGYGLIFKAGHFLRGDILTHSQYIDRKKLTARLVISDPDSQDGYRKIDLGERESAEIFDLGSKSVVSKAISKVVELCSKLVGG